MHALEIRFHAALVELINEYSKNEIDHLAAGKATDWADYRYRVGVLKGLEYAAKLAQQLADQDRQAERDRNQMMRDYAS